MTVSTPNWLPSMIFKGQRRPAPDRLRGRIFWGGGSVRKTLAAAAALVLIWQGICPAGTLKVTDQAGRTVRVSPPARRVVTTFIPATLFALCAGLGDALVGASNKDGTSSLYEVLIDPAHPPVLVGNRTAGLSLETIFSLAPDLVIMYGQKDGTRLADRLTAMGVPAIVIMPESLAGMKQALDLIGRASGRTAHTRQVLNAMDRIESLVAAGTAAQGRPGVYYAASRLLSTVSGDMLQDEMIGLAGGRNVSGDTHGFFVTVSREQVLAWNPDVIFTSDRLSREGEKRLYSPEFAMLRAVTENRVFKVPRETYWDFPSPLGMAWVLWMAGKIHPQSFGGQMVRDEINLLYDTLFGAGFSRKYPHVCGNGGN